MPPKKDASSVKRKKNVTNLPAPFKQGTTLNDVHSKPWILDTVVGQGGFGVLYLARSGVVPPPAENGNQGDSAPSTYVVKIEPHENGPLFCEMNFYLRAARANQLEDWKQQRELTFVGVPRLWSHGSHRRDELDYRFLVLPRLGTDLQRVWREQAHGKFSVAGACQAAAQCVDALEFVHAAKYAHADVKGANLLLEHGAACRVYLVDFGLVERFTERPGSDVHRAFKVDPRRCHDGTPDYCSRDAHRGVAPSRRGDLEGLLWTLLEWLAGRLPWSGCLADRQRVAELKEAVGKAPRQAPAGCGKLPRRFLDFMEAVLGLAYEQQPDYQELRAALRAAALAAGGDPAPGALQLVPEEPVSTSAAPRAKRAAAGAKKASVAKKAHVVNGAVDSAKATASATKLPIGAISEPPPSLRAAEAVPAAAKSRVSSSKRVRAVKTPPVRRSPRRSVLSPDLFDSSSD